MRLPRAATFVLVALGIGALPGRALAQAWLPARGDGTLTVAFQESLARGELTTDGRLIAAQDTVLAHGLTSEVEWGLTDRIAMSLTLPVVTAKYTGDDPHPVDIHGEPSGIDDGTYHGGAQDLRFGIRYGLKTGALAIAPLAEATIPSRHYESLGHSVIGKDLRAFRMGVNVGGFLDAVASGLYVQSQLSYTVAQQIAGIRPNRSGLDSEVGYFVTPRLALRFVESLLIVHNGTDFPDPKLRIPVFLLNHDRLQKNKILNLGGGVAFAFTDSLSRFAAFAGMVWGRNVHPHKGINGGLTWHFRTGRGAVAPSTNLAPRAGIRDRSKPLPH